MEIKFLNVSVKIKNNLIVSHLNLIFKSKEITGIYGDFSSIIPRILLSDIDYTGKILVNEKEKKSYYRKKISYISSYHDFLTETVSDEFYLANKDLNNSSKKYIEKVITSLKMVGLSQDYLKRKNNSLSKSEKKLIQIALGFISNPEVILLENSFSCLDGKNRLRIKEMIQTLKQEYDKTIIIIDKDIDNLYELSDKIIMLEEGKVITTGTPNEVFHDLEFIKEMKLELPSILEFILDSTKYKKQLSHCKNLKELLKDVYENVKESHEEI